MFAPRRRIRTAALAMLLVGVGPASCHTRPVVPPGASKIWPEMNLEERKIHMASVVLPAMKRKFQAHDPKRFSEFGCETCHGEGAEARNYEMPNPDLAVIDPSRGYRKHKKESKEIVWFMWREVEPETAELLGLPRYVLAHKKGFHCVACHVHEGE